jgi:hypothetical protein
MLKENIQIIILGAVVLALTACASAPKKTVIPKKPIAVTPSSTVNQHKKSKPVAVKKKIAPKYVATLTEGDLLSNLQRVATRYRFRLVWQLAPYNYHVVGNTKIYAKSFDELIKQLVQNYPVKIKIYTKNKVIVVAPEYDLQMSQSNNG